MFTLVLVADYFIQSSLHAEVVADATRPPVYEAKSSPTPTATLTPRAKATPTAKPTQQQGPQQDLFDEPAKTSPTQNAGNRNVKVWVNTASGVYHCPGKRWYGNTKQGEYMTQKQAQDKGYRPAYGNVCE